MRPLSIALLVATVAACFVAALAHDVNVAMAARLVYGLAFAGAIVAFARLLPRTPEDVAPRHDDAVSHGRPGASFTAHG